MHFDVFTLFPGMFAGIFTDSILKRAQEAGIMTVALHNIRDYAQGKHRVTDDTPYGGGGGMVMKPEPIFRAVETVLSRGPGWTFIATESGIEPPVPEPPSVLPAGRPHHSAVATRPDLHTEDRPAACRTHPRGVDLWSLRGGR